MKRFFSANLIRTSAILAASVAVVLLQTGALMAADGRDRVSIDDDWRFTKGDPADITDNLTYPHSPATTGQRQSADIGPYPGAAATGIAAFILPTGNAFISNPKKRFARPEGNYGAAIPYVSRDFDDSAWRKLDLPHDFGIEGPFISMGNGDMGKLPFYGAVWYRKHLDLPAGDAGKQIFLDVDGAMSYSTVWCNGQIVGGWPYGYSSYRLDLTSFLKPGAVNTLAIRLDNPNNSSRWYPGGGIYRHVWLTKTSPVHVAQWGTYVTTPQITKDNNAFVKLEVVLQNDTKEDAAGVQVSTSLFELDAQGQRRGNAVGTDQALRVELPAGKDVHVNHGFKVGGAKLWSPNSPNRYVAVTTVSQNGNVVDTYETPFGIRTVKMDPNTGLSINGEHFKLNGVCDHHDLGALGTGVNVRALQRQLQMLRDMGCNAIRTSHNPPAPELLEFADQMGFMILDEAFDTWQSHKSGHTNDYGGDMLFNVWHEQDTRALVRRDRNHPSIIMWSIGNEIDEQRQGGNSNVAKELAAIVHSEDMTRPVTAACNGASSARNGFAALLDTMGFNYQPDAYIPFHRDFPNQSFFSTESSSTISSRGEYFFPVTAVPFGVVNQSSNPSAGRGRRGAPATSAPASAPATAPARTFLSQDDATHQMSSYDLYSPGWASNPDHEFFGQDHSDACMGEFVWTGWDYIGEPTPFANNGPRSSYFGIIDLAGFPKDRYYLYQAHWRPDFPMAHILPHWNWPDRVGQITPVFVYTSGDEAELFLNGKSLGRKKKIFENPIGRDGKPLVVNGIPANGQPAYRIRWDDVKYEPGELKVVAYKDGKHWATDTVKTTSAPAQLQLKPDRNAIAGDGHDLSFITLTVADKDGLMVPRTHNDITFEISGPGEIVATDNGDPNDMNIFSVPQRKAFNGLALAIVKAKRGQTGTITVTAKSEGLTTASTKIELK